MLCIGALCGSEFVNQNFIKWLKQHPDGFQAQCTRLGITETTCIKRAATAFEEVKVRFTSANNIPGWVLVQGSDDPDSPYWIVRPNRLL